MTVSGYNHQPAPRPDQCLAVLVGALQVNRGDAAFALLKGEADAFAFIQLTQAGALDGADMDENIVPAGFRRDEAIAFAGVEPFNDASQRVGMLGRVVFLQLCRFHLKHLCSALMFGRGTISLTGGFADKRNSKPYLSGAAMKNSMAG
jgi:hypothetical protein